MSACASLGGRENPKQQRFPDLLRAHTYVSMWARSSRVCISLQFCAGKKTAQPCRSRIQRINTHHILTYSSDIEIADWLTFVEISNIHIALLANVTRRALESAKR